MKPNHSPGPWKLTQESIDPEWHIVTINGWRLMANIHIEQGNAVDMANAQLICAAPELLEALKMAVRYMPNDASERTERQFVNAVIAKAEGETI